MNAAWQSRNTDFAELDDQFQSYRVSPSGTADVVDQAAAQYASGQGSIVEIDESALPAPTAP